MQGDNKIDIKEWRYLSISLGQGQGAKAAVMIKDLSNRNEQGGWVLL